MKDRIGVSEIAVGVVGLLVVGAFLYFLFQLYTADSSIQFLLGMCILWLFAERLKRGKGI